MVFERELTNGMNMIFNGKPAVDQIERWVLLSSLKKIVMEEGDKELACPLCKEKVYTCDCHKNIANEILYGLLYKEIEKNTEIYREGNVE